MGAGSACAWRGGFAGDVMHSRRVRSRRWRWVGWGNVGAGCAIAVRAVMGGRGRVDLVTAVSAKLWAAVCGLHWELCCGLNWGTYTCALAAGMSRTRTRMTAATAVRGSPAYRGDGYGVGSLVRVMRPLVAVEES
ncbi:hypothetical protein C2E23DRAFT_223830 [Lenzites betulinus]|nr:hypothetical protein C2E23DRAFT_223830 [Lenzites betulinus]